MSGGTSVTDSIPGDVTVLLGEVEKGSSEARDELIQLLYPDLKRLAESRMRFERKDHTIQPTALVSELFLALHRANGIKWRNRSHFLAVASEMMRRYLIDHARAHRAKKRGGGSISVQLEALQAGKEDFDVLEIAELLEKLAVEEPRMARVVDMRCFGKLTHAEIADALGVDERTSKRDWHVARAWMQSQLTKRPPHHDG